MHNYSEVSPAVFSGIYCQANWTYGMIRDLKKKKAKGKDMIEVNTIIKDVEEMSLRMFSSSPIIQELKVTLRS